MADFYRRFSKYLRDNGCVLISNTGGSHEKWKNSSTNKVTSVPKTTKSRFTLRDICKQLEIPKPHWL